MPGSRLDREKVHRIENQVNVRLIRAGQHLFTLEGKGWIVRNITGNSKRRYVGGSNYQVLLRIHLQQREGLEGSHYGWKEQTPMLVTLKGY